MNRNEFRKLLSERVLILDGATGTELAKRGMPAGVCPESWALENRNAILDVQRSYYDAGSDIVYTCTFGGNRVKLAEFGLEDRLVEINAGLAAVTVEAAAGRGYAFGDLAPTGKLVQPFGDLPFEEAVDIYKEQVAALLGAGVDGFVIETMMDIQEARAALIAVRESCDLPCMVSMTYGDDGRTLTGTSPITALITLQALGADAVGCNCSTGPADMITFIQAMKPYATIPIFAKPNAGMPELVDGKTLFRMGAEEFASYVSEFVKRGANLFGGCCGSTPEHVRAAAEEAAKCRPHDPVLEAVSATTSSRKAAFFGEGRPVGIIGERINPTGKKKLQAELREGKMNLVRQYAMEQAEKGAAMLDVNFGLSGIDEKAMMLEAVDMLSQITDLPLCIDTTKPDVMEAALRVYPGRALVNSISFEKERIEKMLPVAAKYGAMMVLLPLTDDDIPATAAGRIEVADKIFAELQKYGCHKEDVVVDGIVMAVSADTGAAKATLEFIRWCANDWGVNTTIGTSNISFGMPQRKTMNTAFLTLAIANGLSMAIANPSEELMMDLKVASDALIGRDHKLQAYLKRFVDRGKNSAAPAKSAIANDPGEAVFNAVVLGDEGGMHDLVKAALDSGIEPQDVVDQHLIPAIAKVGDLFDRKEYFLPQLMMGADAMKKAFDVLDPMLASGDGGSAKASIVLATVKGDIHDIGKNLVGLMLKNYGFKVIDLGKDVSAEVIVEEAKRYNAHIIALSALMTTTMVEMPEVIKLARAEGLQTRFMIGGAVVDQAYADEIGADGYSEDAMSAVRLAEKLTE